MRVWFEFRHDVRTVDGRSFICARVFAGQPPMAGTGLWGTTEIDVWIPFSETASMADLREAALAAAKGHARQFAELPRDEITFESGGEI